MIRAETILTDRQTDRQTDRRNYFIDSLKGICIVFVIVTHYSWTDAERLKYLFPFWIDMAVPIFMILSGYVANKSFERRGISTLSCAYSLRRILSKLLRYTVPFLFAYSIEVVALAIINREHIGPLYLLKLFLTGALGPGGYYYPIMIQFIFVFPVIYFIIKKNNYMGVLICFGLNVLYEIVKITLGMSESCYRLLLFRYIFVIAVGCYYACNHNRRINKPLCLLCLAIGVTFILVTQYCAYQPPVLTYWTRTSCVACMYIVPIIGLCFQRCKNFRFAVLELFGKASYNIFLVQMVYYWSLGQFVSNAISNAFICVLVNLVICLGGGIAFYFLETPITNKIMKMISCV